MNLTPGHRGLGDEPNAVASTFRQSFGDLRTKTLKCVWVTAFQRSGRVRPSVWHHDCVVMVNLNAVELESGDLPLDTPTVCGAILQQI